MYVLIVQYILHSLHRNKARVKQRLQQVEDLSQRLEEFDKKYSVLLGLVKEGTTLLEREQPIGSTANRITEQTTTCQVQIYTCTLIILTFFSFFFISPSLFNALEGF